MVIGKTNSSLTREEILNRISEAEIISHYLGVSIPCVTNSPFRQDKHPSFALYAVNKKEANYIDYATGERGSCFRLLSRLWKTDYQGVINKLAKDLGNNSIKKSTFLITPGMSNPNIIGEHSTIELKCKIREWQDYDIEYWKSYGVSLEWLKYAEVYPISHKFIIKNGQYYTFKADKYAYAFIERKEGNVTMKFYQPFNTTGYKWQNNNDGSVLGLWTKIPKFGDKVIICSSVKDALCVMSNLKIPCICLQGEGYPISDTAAKELVRRFRHVLILLDNDEAGIRNAKRLEEQTGFINIELPQFEGGKDVSDLYKQMGENVFKQTLNNLIETAIYEWDNELPF